MFTTNQQTNTFLAYLLPMTYFSMIVALLVFQSLTFQKSFFPVDQKLFDQKLLPMTLRCNGNQIHIGKKTKESVIVFYSATGKNILFLSPKGNKMIEY